MRVPPPAPRLRLIAVTFALLALVAGCTKASPNRQPTDTGVSVVPTAPPSSPAEKARALAAQLSDTELVGQILMPSVGLSGDVSGAAAAVSQNQLGGVILMGNVENRGAAGTASEVRELTDALQAAGPTLAGQRIPLLIGTDQEYGWVTRIPSGIVQLPSGMTFGAAGKPDLTQAAWAGAGQDLAAIGINVDFAPDSDVIANPANYVIGSRSFGSDPARVSPQVAAAVSGLQSSGVAATLKHFPGHGNTSVDSHTDLPALTQSRAALEANDLAPFRAGIAAGVQLIMSGHLNVTSIDPGVPATFSAKVLGDVLRGELGYQGVIVTDALNMSPAMQWPPGESAVRAFLAGNDLLLMPADLGLARAGLLAAVQSGRIPRDRLLASVTRILALKFTLAANTPSDMSTVNSAQHQAAAAAVNVAAVTLLKGSCSGPLVSGPVRVTTSTGRDGQGAILANALAQAGMSVVTSGGTQVHLVGYGDGPAALAPGATVTVSMDTPYVLASATSPVLVATYSSTPAALQALAAVIAGKAPATGRSPVPVSGLPASACVA